MDTRMGRVTWGANGTRVRTGEAYWRQPLAWNREASRQHDEMIREERDRVPMGLGDPANHMPMRRPRVFCASLADVFEPDPGGKWGLDAWRADLFELIRRTPNLDWLLLTKRPAKVMASLRCLLKQEWAKQHKGTEFFYWLEHWEKLGEPPANVWIGATVENQEVAASRIPDLVKIPARVRFLSCEPLLGPVNLGKVDAWWTSETGALLEGEKGRLGVDWVIAGGESGPKARPMNPDWARSLRDQCQAAGVPFLFKQWGEWAPLDGSDAGHPTPCKFWRDGDWMDGITTQDTPHVVRVGKKEAGRMLDGRTWDEFPKEVAR